MKTLRIAPIALVTLAALALAAPAAAQSFSLDLEAGYQWVTVDGNEDMYRTQVDQDDGFVLRGLHLNLLDPASDGIVDRLVVDASGFGGDPTGQFRLEAGLAKTYRVRFNYRTTQMFSALPALANPFAEEGIVPGQHTFDRDRTMFDLDVELFPGHVVSAIFGYRFNEIDGPRRTTYHMGQDEFALASELEETEDEYYLGATFNVGGWAGSLIQGWRNFEATERLHLVAGAEAGNNLFPVLGQDISASSFERTTSTEADTPVTTFHVAGNLDERLAVRASYVHADSEADTMSEEMAAGSLASFRVARFFAGLDESVASNTESPSWRGEVEFSMALSDALSVDLGLSKRRRTMDGWAMISTLYSDTMTFGGLSTEDVQRVVEVENASRRDDESFDLLISVAPEGPIDLWFGAKQVASKLDLQQDAAQIVVQGGQDGRFERTVNSYVMGGAVKAGKGRVSLDVESAEADDPIMRLDFTRRTSFRARVQLPIAEMLDLTAVAGRSFADNFASGVGYEADTNHYGLDLDFRPTDYASFHFTWDAMDTETSVDMREPQDFSTVESFYADDSTVLDGWLQIDLERLGFAVGYSIFENDGSFELELDRSYFRVDVKLCEVASAVFEYETYDYSEDLFTAADFDSERIGVFIRMHY